MGFARLQTGPFSLDEILGQLVTPGTGGVTFYVGTVRGDDDGEPIASLTYEAYPEMAQTSLEALRLETIAKFKLTDAAIIHRTGTLRAGESILLVALAGSHRAETYDAVRFLMDRLKQIVPVWKEERGPGGRAFVLGAANVRERL